MHQHGSTQVQLWQDHEDRALWGGKEDQTTQVQQTMQVIKTIIIIIIITFYEYYC